MLVPWLRKWFRRSAQALRSTSPKKRSGGPSHFRPMVEELETRLAPSTFAWTGLGDGANFSNSNNWLNASTNAPGTPGNGDSLLFPLNGPSAPGTVTDDLAGTTNFNSLTFLSAGWTVAAKAGDTIGITNAINDDTNIANSNAITAPLDFSAATSSVGINVVNPDGANSNLLILSGAVNLGSAGMTYTGFGELNVGGVVSGNGSIVANASSRFTLTAANTYTGGTSIVSGIVQANNTTALGTGTVTVNNGGSLSLAATNIANALNLNGFGFGGNGALQDFGGNLVYDGAITLQTSSSINVGFSSATLVGTGSTTGSISGPGGLTIVGTNTGSLVDQDTGTYTGVTNVLGATLILSSPAAGQAGGTNTGTTGYVVSQGGTLNINNGTQVTNNRIGTTAFVELDGGSLTFTGLNATTENFAALNLGNANGGGVNTIIGSNTVNLGAVNNAVTVGTLNRFPGSTVTFLGTNFGTTNTITFGAFGAGAGLVNGILPYANVSIGGGPNTFVTDVTPGTTPLTAAVPTLTNTFAGATATSNVLINSGGTIALAGNTTINSLALAAGSTVNLNGFALTLNSGAILTETSNTHIIESSVAGGALLFQNSVPAAVEGIIQNPAGTLAIGTIITNTVPITAGSNLTLAVSALNFNGGTATNSTYTGTTWVTSGGVNLGVSAAADVIPTLLVIGDGAGGANADNVQVLTNFQQIGTAAAPDDVIINSTGNLNVNGNNQSVRNLTMHSGLFGATVGSSPSGTLTITGTVTSGGDALSPTANLPGGLPTVTNFKPSDLAPANLILAPGGVAAGTAVFNVGKTPAIVNDGEEDLILNATIGAGSATLDKQGAGVLVIDTLPAAAYTGSVQIDGGEFAVGVANFAQNITVNAGGTLGNDPGSTGPGTIATAGAITVNGGTVNPGLPPSPLSPSNSQNGFYGNNGTATTPDFSAGGVLSLHIDGYGNTADWDQFVGTNGPGLQVTLGGTSILTIDLLGLAQSGLLTGKVVNGVGASPFIWANPLNGKFSNAPNATNNILPAANVLNNPTGFQVIVSYGAGFISVSIGHPATVGNATYTTTENTALTVSSRGVLADVTDPDFIGAESEAFLDGVNNPGTYTGSNGGTLLVNADGSFTYTPSAGFVGSETFTLTAVTPRGAVSTPFTVTFTVTSSTPPTPPVQYFAVGADAGAAPQVIVYNATTGGILSTFYAFAPTFTGGVRVAVADINGDGTPDIIAAAGLGGGPQVEVINGTMLNAIQANGEIAPSALLASFYAFTPTFTGGVSVAAGVGSSGKAELLLGAGPGGGPQVELLDGTKLSDVQSNGEIASAAQLANFFAYAPTFTGGVNVALGDVNGDGTLDIITGAGPGGGPQVNVINGTLLSQLQSNGQIASSALLASFFAFAPTFTGGVSVSGGDTAPGSFQFNLIVSAGPGGGPQVEVINGGQLTQVQSNGQIANSALLGNFFALPAEFTGGVRVGFAVAAGSNNRPTILTAAGPGGSPQVNLFDAETFQAIDAFFALPEAFTGGLFVGGAAKGILLR